MKKYFIVLFLRCFRIFFSFSQDVFDQYSSRSVQSIALIPQHFIIVGLCLEFVPSLCRTYDITMAALPLHSVIALRAQLSSAVKSNLLY